MIRDYRRYYSNLMLMAFLTGMLSFATVSCSSNDNAVEKSELSALADRVWEYSLEHPDEFTIDVRTWTLPTEGLCVSYKETQDSHSREQLDKVVEHALRHDGYVGGWLNAADGRYYFDSTRLFPEDALDDAIRFGKENGQRSVFVLSSSTDIPVPSGMTNFSDL